MRRKRTIRYDTPTIRRPALLLAPGTYNLLADSGKFRCGSAFWEFWYPTEWQGTTQRNWENMDATICAAVTDGYGDL